MGDEARACAGFGAAASRRELGGAVGKRRKRRKRQSACGGQQGVLHFKPASARHGKAKPGTWRPHGGRSLLSVGPILV